MGPAEFCELTERQLELLLEAAGEQQKADRRFQANMTANLMNCQLSKGHVTGDDLLGLSRKNRPIRRRKSYAEMDELQRSAALEEIKNRANVKGQSGKQASATT